MEFLSDIVRNSAQYIGLMLLGVLALLGLYAFVRRSGNAAFPAALRGKTQRLQIVESMVVHGPGRRMLLLVRRDGVEHLVMIGGPNDLVVEQTIVRGMPMGTVPGLSRNMGPVAPPANDGQPAAAPQPDGSIIHTESATPVAAMPRQQAATPRVRTFEPPLPPAPSRVQTPAPPLAARTNEALQRPHTPGQGQGQGPGQEPAAWRPAAPPPAPAPSRREPAPAPRAARPLDDIASRLEEALLDDAFAAGAAPQPAADMPPPASPGIIGAFAGSRGPAAIATAKASPAPETPLPARTLSTGWMKTRLAPELGPAAKPPGRDARELEADRNRFDQTLARITETAPAAPDHATEPAALPDPDYLHGSEPGTGDDLSQLLGELSGERPKPRQ